MWGTPSRLLTAGGGGGGCPAAPGRRDASRCARPAATSPAAIRLTPSAMCTWKKNNTKGFCDVNGHVFFASTPSHSLLLKIWINWYLQSFWKFAAFSPTWQNQILYEPPKIITFQIIYNSKKTPICSFSLSTQQIVSIDNNKYRIFPIMLSLEFFPRLFGVDPDAAGFLLRFKTTFKKMNRYFRSPRMNNGRTSSLILC